MKKHPQLMTLALSLATALAIAPAARAEKPVKVFILAGQSNMEGKAQNSLLEFQATDPKTKDLFAHLRKGDAWIVRDDVFIKYLNQVSANGPVRTFAAMIAAAALGTERKKPAGSS